MNVFIEGEWDALDLSSWQLHDEKGHIEYTKFLLLSTKAHTFLLIPKFLKY